MGVRLDKTAFEKVELKTSFPLQGHMLIHKKKLLLGGTKSFKRWRDIKRMKHCSTEFSVQVSWLTTPIILLLLCVKRSLAVLIAFVSRLSTIGMTEL
jgi:hypothetical protein